jgi:hypothetical protein
MFYKDFKQTNDKQINSSLAIHSRNLESRVIFGTKSIKFVVEVRKVGN